MNKPAVAISTIGTAATRIRGAYESIQQGHAFGIAPGPHDEPWGPEFHRAAALVYFDKLPPQYLADLSLAFNECVELMSTTEAPPGFKVEWARMQSYLACASKEMRDRLPDVIDLRSPKGAADIDEVAPPIIPFGEFAALVSAEGVHNMLFAARSVESFCVATVECPINEREKCWLRRISRGDSTIDIAVAAGYSERSFYRVLSELWRRIGVNNRLEAVALANKNGWL